jgi:serine/threonine-protein kinase TNNI3K
MFTNKLVPQSDVCRGLNWLHHKAIIHRDLKTANILLDANGRAKIADFGLSHVKRRTGDATGGFYGVCGTSCYMAPEVLRKAPYGVKADCFSFAIVLCEMVMGRYKLLSP